MTFDLSIDFAHNFGVNNTRIANFYKHNWDRPIALSKPEFLDWQFGSSCENHCVVAMLGSEIVGVMAVNPRSFLCNNISYNGAELSTWCVNKKVRGLGVGKKILRFLQSNFEVLIGAGITPIAVPIYLSLGFSFSAFIPRFIFVSDFEKIQKFAKFDLKSERITKSRRVQQPAQFVNKKSDASELASLKSTPSFVGFERGHDYCLWRYEDHPLFDYQFHLITDQSGAKAGVVLRKDSYQNTDFMHVCDLFGEQQAFISAVCFIEQYSENIGVAFVDATVTEANTIGAFRQRGWISAVDDNYVQIPSLFYPLEIRSPATTSVIFWTTEDVPCGFNLSAMTLAKGDLDLDRPTLSFYEKRGVT